MARLAFRILCRKWIRSCVSLAEMSLKNPKWWKLDFGIKHRGHGQRPLSWIVASRTLQSKSVRATTSNEIALLLGVVSGVREYSWIHPPGDAIKAFDHYTVVVCLNKLIV